MRRKNNGKKEKKQTCLTAGRQENKSRVDLGRKKFSISDLSQEFNNLFDLVSIIKEKAEEIKKEGKLKKFRNIKKVIYGFCIRTTGIPIVESFGNIKKIDKKTIIEEEREPLVDVFNNASQILIMAELSGVEQNDIRLEVKNKILIISAKGKERQYKKEILLPDSVEKFVPLQTFKNGILEIKFLKPHR